MFELAKGSRRNDFGRQPRYVGFDLNRARSLDIFTKSHY